MVADQTQAGKTVAVKPRWLYRFDNYRRAFGLLREAVEQARAQGLDQLQKEGAIQRFEYAWELAWKVLKDYLDAQGAVLETVTPAAVIKAAFAAKIIADGEPWMRALDARNKMSHTYDFRAFEQVLADIDQTYLALLDGLYMYLLARSAEAELG